MLTSFDIVEQEAMAWAREKFGKIICSGRPFLPKVRSRFVLTSPSEASVILTTSIGLAALCSEGSLLFWLTDWHDNVEKGLDFLARIGWLRAPDDLKSGRQGALVNPDDSVRRLSEIILVLQFLIAFGWEGAIYDPDGALYVWVADGVIDVGANDRKRVETEVRRLDVNYERRPPIR